jgi:protein kinase X
MVVAAFDYLHDRLIVYRDLKPENLLFDADGYLKVVDFGFAKRVEDRTWTVCGTPEYMAPEIILNKGHGVAVDWWTVGILLYELFVGYPPYEGKDAMDLYKKIVSGDIKYPKKITPQGQDCIRKLLHPSQTERLGSSKDGAEDVKKHGFYKKLAWQSLLAKKIEAPFKPKINDPLDTSNFEEFDDPDEGVPVNSKLPKGLFHDFSAFSSGMKQSS